MLHVGEVNVTNPFMTRFDPDRMYLQCKPRTMDLEMTGQDVTSWCYTDCVVTMIVPVVCYLSSDPETAFVLCIRVAHSAFSSQAMCHNCLKYPA